MTEHAPFERTALVRLLGHVVAEVSALTASALSPDLLARGQEFVAATTGEAVVAPEQATRRLREGLGLLREIQPSLAALPDAVEAQLLTDAVREHVVAMLAPAPQPRRSLPFGR